VRLTAEVLFAGEAEWDQVLLYDLSAGGAAVHASRSISVQSELRLRYRLPDKTGGEGKVIETLCLVVRTGDPRIHDPSRPFVAGLHFLDLLGEDFDAVRAFVWGLLHPS
jgi:c-di-GMP-binding flagellar brake protein YcgR